MEEVVEYNRRVDRNKIQIFEVNFKLNGAFIDISDWEFRFLLKNSVQVTQWDIQNADFSRPNDYTIKFIKTPEQVYAVEEGNYTISLLATYTGEAYKKFNMIDNELMKGIWYFN